MIPGSHHQKLDRDMVTIVAQRGMAQHRKAWHSMAQWA